MQAFFGQYSANLTQLKLPFFEFFRIFDRVLSFFREFLKIFQKGTNNFSFLKTFYNKNGVFRGNLRFLPKNKAFILFCATSTQLRLPVFEFFGFFLEFFSECCLSF